MRCATCPIAAHPTYTQGYYDRDNEFYLQWDKLSATPESIHQYLDEWVYGVADRQEYWKKLGDAAHSKLSVKEKLSVPVNYGQY